MRLFLALLPDPAVRRELIRIQEAFRRESVKGRWAGVENLHLTLAFIGEHPDPDAVLEALERFEAAPFSMRLQGFGRFGDVLWVGVDGGDGLRDCARRVRYLLDRGGVPFDRKRFSPHITLARGVRGELPAMAGLRVSAEAFAANRISLMRSDRGKQGMIYTEIGSIPMGGDR